jgi:hypothetical protein
MSGYRAWFADFSHFTDRGAAVIAGLIADNLHRTLTATLPHQVFPGR